MLRPPVALHRRFNLTAGDSASVPSGFHRVPEPHSALLVAGGLLARLGAGRRLRG